MASQYEYANDHQAHPIWGPNYADYAPRPPAFEELDMKERLNRIADMVKICRGAVESTERRIDSSRSETNVALGMYFIFMGVIIHTVTEKRLECRHLWIPFWLTIASTLAAVVVAQYKLNCRIMFEQRLDKEKKRLRFFEDKLSDLNCFIFSEDEAAVASSSGFNEFMEKKFPWVMTLVVFFGKNMPWPGKTVLMYTIFGCLCAMHVCTNEGGDFGAI